MPVSSARAFTPTPAQLRFLDYVHAHPGFSTIAELCASCDVDPSSYYKWCHNPAFKQWLTAEWSSRLLFEGWHFLNLARANCTNSATHFRVLMNLLFDPKGQAALTAWQQSASSQDPAQLGDGDAGAPIPGRAAGHAPSQRAGSQAGGGASHASAAGCPRPSMLWIRKCRLISQTRPPIPVFRLFPRPSSPIPG